MYYTPRWEFCQGVGGIFSLCQEFWGVGVGWGVGKFIYFQKTFLPKYMPAYRLGTYMRNGLHL